MSNPYRNALAELYVASQLHTGLNPAAADVCPAELVRRLMEAMAASAALLAQPELPELTDPARFAAWLRKHSSDCMELGRPDWAHMISRAAELLDRLASDNAGLEAAAEFFYLYNLSLLDGQND